ncbi:hypothetical protein CLV47_102394 [Antricoccus suffuscus]|uniref:Uncharacterized protein n=1 Tax=Antricoccus suffuscus TaxID=1629062 RepID=A0A2T1A527_9ACTN|nr:hypothetical protein [Antricoccus suffuscus]PRZ43703.1 hypothetical protein CLV47_102394 [Antricoccus suffuscus]
MIDARALAAAVRTQPGVATLHPGPLGTASTFTAAGRVWGIRISPDAIDVHVVVRPGFSLVALAQALTAIVGSAVDDPAYTGEIRVHVEDLLVDEKVTTLAALSFEPHLPADAPPSAPPASLPRRKQ